MHMRLLSIFLLLGTSLVLASQEECLQALKNSTSVNNFLLSGKSINEYGLYDQCLKSKDLHYLTLTFKAPNIPLLLINIGVCLSKSCSSGEVRSMIPSLFSSYNISIDSSSLMVVDPVADRPTMDAGSCVVTAIIFFLVGLSVVSPFIINKFNKKMLAKKTIAEEDTTRLSVNENSSETLLERSKHERPPSKTPPLYITILSCFDIYKNYNKFFEIKDGPLAFLNGIRSLSLFYVIWAHEYYIRSNNVSNVQGILDVFNQPIGLVTMAGIFAVDVFFWLSGFFLAYVILEPSKKRLLKKPPIYAMAIVHRYFRIVPSYIIAIIIYWKILMLTGDGPIWNQITFTTDNCYKMWRNVLFIDNFFDFMNSCYGWGWYLSNDFQMFIYSLIMVFLYARFGKKFGMAAIFLSISVSFIISFSICFDENFGVLPWSLKRSMADFWNIYYIKPWIRCPAYLIGLVMGILYRDYINYLDDVKKNPIEAKEIPQPFLYRISQYIFSRFWLRLVLYFVGLGLINLFIFVPHDLQVDPASWTRTGETIYVVFSRSGYVLGLNLLFLPSFLGHKDWFGRLMEFNVFGYIARISFASYLVHYWVIQRNILSRKQAMYFETDSFVYYTATDLLLTLLVAFAFNMFVEVPFMSLEKILFEGSGAKKPRKEVEGDGEGTGDQEGKMLKLKPGAGKEVNIN